MCNLYVFQNMLPFIYISTTLMQSHHIYLLLSKTTMLFPTSDCPVCMEHSVSPPAKTPPRLSRALAPESFI